MQITLPKLAAAKPEAPSFEGLDDARPGNRENDANKVSASVAGGFGLFTATERVFILNQCLKQLTTSCLQSFEHPVGRTTWAGLVAKAMPDRIVQIQCT